MSAIGSVILINSVNQFRIWDCGLRILFRLQSFLLFRLNLFQIRSLELRNARQNPQSAIPNPKSGHQLDLTTPGIWPWSARSRSAIRETPNFRRYPRVLPD